jgi:carbon storage regulator
MPNLILSRRPGESFTIGDDVTVTILENDGHAVRISIEAPRDTLILRSELEHRPTTGPAAPTKPIVHHKARKRRLP